jgi:HEAT repeat protein
MPVPRSFKTDASFLEKIAIGAIGTRRVFEDLASQGHEPFELERGSMSFKIWKGVKVKRLRVPDILCVRCARRVESRAKTKLVITMSHSVADPQRGWDAGLADDDLVALIACRRVGTEPTDWQAGDLVQYIRVPDLRQAVRAGHVIQERPKGAGEGFEIRLTWPSVTAREASTVESVDDKAVRLVGELGRQRVTLKRTRLSLTPLVHAGESVPADGLVAAVVPVELAIPCSGGATLGTYVDLARSSDRSNRFAAMKALSRFASSESDAALVGRLKDDDEDLHVRLEAAAGLMRRGHGQGEDFLRKRLEDEYLSTRLEAAIVLGEVANEGAAALLIDVLGDPSQEPEIRAGAAWSLGEIGRSSALPALISAFNELALEIRFEAARALARIARAHATSVVRALPGGSEAERPGIAWALGKAGSFDVDELLRGLVDDDARHWIAYVLGTQPPAGVAGALSGLASRDPNVYFAVNVLWKILNSWVYGLEEY